MDGKNERFVKVIDAMDKAGCEVLSMAPERIPNACGGFSETGVLQVRIMPSTHPSYSELLMESIDSKKG